MNDDTTFAQLPAIPEPADLAQFDPLLIQEFVDQRIDMARRWLNQAYALMQADEIDTKAVEIAIYSVNDNLTPLEGLRPVFAGIGAGIEEIIHQRDEAVEAYEHLEEEFEERLRREVDTEVVDTVAQIFARDDDAEEAEIEMWARQMYDTCDEDVVEDVIGTVSRKLKRAKELASDYRANGLPDEEYTLEVEDENDDAAE